MKAAHRFQVAQALQALRIQCGIPHVGRKSPGKFTIRVEQARRHHALEPRSLQHDAQLIVRISEGSERFDFRQIGCQIHERHGIEHFAVSAGDLLPDSGPQLQSGKQDSASQTGQRDADQYPSQPPGAQQQLLDWRNVFHAKVRRSDHSEVAAQRALICCGAREIATSALRRSCAEKWCRFAALQNVQVNPPLTVFTAYCSEARLEMDWTRSYSAKIFKNLDMRRSKRRVKSHSLLRRLAWSFALTVCTG